MAGSHAYWSRRKYLETFWWNHIPQHDLFILASYFLWRKNLIEEKSNLLDYHSTTAFPLFLTPFFYPWAFIFFPTALKTLPLFLALFLLNEGGLYHIAKPSSCKMKEVFNQWPDHLLMYGGGFLSLSTLFSCIEEIFSVMPFHPLSNSVIFPFAAFSCLRK